VNIKDLARKVLPFAKLLGTALGGPAGPVLNMALSAAGKSLGVAPEPEAIEAAIYNDPDALLKLRAANHHFDIEMKRLGVDVFRLENEDRQDARATMAKTNMWPQSLLSALFIGGYFTVLWALFSGEVTIPPELTQISNILLGILTVNVPIIMQFWFGSSAGSKLKDTAAAVKKP
jgi:hypothetical protein